MKTWNKPVTFWVATFQTPNFEFKAYGSTEAEARMFLNRGLIRHASQYNLLPLWYQKWENDICCHPISLGDSYRDNEVLTTIEEYA